MSATESPLYVTAHHQPPSDALRAANETFLTWDREKKAEAFRYIYEEKLLPALQQSTLAEAKERLDASLEVIDPLNNESDAKNRLLDPSSSVAFLLDTSDAFADPEKGKELISTLPIQEESDYVFVPASVPMMDVMFEEFQHLCSASTKDIMTAYRLEDTPAIHEVSGAETHPGKVAEHLQRNLLFTINDMYTTLRQAVKQRHPILSATGYDRVWVVKLPKSEQERILPPGYLSLREFSHLFDPADPVRTNVVGVEGAQGSGKTTMVRMLREKLMRERVPVAEKLPSGKDTMSILKKREGSNGEILPTAQRQEIVRASLGDRVEFLQGQHGYVGLSDRTAISPVMAGITVFRANGTPLDSETADVDRELLSFWAAANPHFWNVRTIILRETDPYTSFFRMRKDPATDNQQADPATQWLEDIIYQTYARLGFGTLVEYSSAKPEEVAQQILAQPEVQNVLNYCEQERKKPEWIRDWLKKEPRVGVWCSPRGILQNSESARKALTRSLVEMEPDMVFVGASGGTTEAEVRETFFLLNEARNTAGTNVRLVDFSPKPADSNLFLMSNQTQDFSIATHYANGNPTLHEHVYPMMKRHAKSLNVGLIDCQYFLFHNGRPTLPSVAHTGGIVSAPDPLKPYQMQGAVEGLGDKTWQLTMVDQGSDPLRVIPDKTIQYMIAQISQLYPDPATRPAMMPASGIVEPEQARHILKIPGVNVIAIGTIFERDPDKAREIMQAVRSMKKR